MKNKIIPAILVKNKKELDQELIKLSALEIVERVQIDFCDGIFVSNFTWPFTEMDSKSFATLFEKSNDLFLPGWKNLNYTADLMINNPTQYLETLAAYGFDEFIIHFRTLKNEEDFRKIEDLCIKYQINLSLAIDLKTDLKTFLNFANKHKDSIVWHNVQVMGIKNIGHQGEEFDDEIIEVIKKIKIELPNKSISVDGGVNNEVIVKCKKVGARIFVIGSYLKDKNVKTEIEKLENI